MKKTALALGILSVIATPVAFAGAVTSEKSDIIIDTQGGLSVETVDEKFGFKIGGRIQADYTFFDGIYNFDNGGDSASEGEFRRTRIEMEGWAYHDWEYFVVDISDQDAEATINDAGIIYNGFGDPFTITVGKFKEPASLERLTSSKWITAMERSLIQDLIDDGGAGGQPDFAGAMLLGYNELSCCNHLNWAVGVFDDGNEDDDGEDNHGVTGRLAGSHFIAGNENHLVHLAGWASERFVGDESQYRLRSRLGVHTADDGRPVLFDTTVDGLTQYGVEGAYQYGPFSLQSEAIWSMGDGDGAFDGEDIDAWGYYVQGAYTLTGEPRSYKAKGGKFDKIKPKGGLGAWELFARYEMIEGEVDNAEPSADVLTMGLNWYPNTNLRFSLNYLLANIDEDEFIGGVTGGDDESDFDGEDDGDGITLRAQFVF